MIKLLASIAVALAAAVPAQAQSNADGHCAKTPNEMLASLDGPWTLTQGAGMASGAAPTGIPGMPVGGVTIPLPANPPQRFTLQYRKAAGHATLSGEGQSMVMVAAGPGQLRDVSAYLGSTEVERLIVKGGGCDWASLPIMIGSNEYTLTDPGSPARTSTLEGLRVHIPGKEYLWYCVGDNGAVRMGGDQDSFVLRLCKWPSRPPQQLLDMKMTLIMKFQGPARGSGVLLFEGTQQRSRFSAIAPITMSR